MKVSESTCLMLRQELQCGDTQQERSSCDVGYIFLVLDGSRTNNLTRIRRKLLYHAIDIYRLCVVWTRDKSTFVYPDTEFCPVPVYGLQERPYKGRPASRSNVLLLLKMVAAPSEQRYFKGQLQAVLGQFSEPNL